MDGNKMKRILDSVHGYIEIDKEYFDNIIDTEEFQRLRRVEQTSTRSIFPSARHDRFIHSLGVFYLGCKIVESLRIKRPEKGYCDKEEMIFESYKIACLLHDVAHSPFSHTFEEYYENEWSDLRGTLCGIVNDEAFQNDWDNTSDRSAPHERMSAIVALARYGDFIGTRGDKELVARMIIGLYYSDEANRSFENAMIELIHGDVIDADGLDYVCRDAWASGYHTSGVDVKRLIDSIWVLKNPDDNKYTLCYDSKSLNEIESAMRVKTFQQYYVINHHTVTYEQRLLVKAMESAALYHWEGKTDLTDYIERGNALRKLCSIKCFYNKDGDVGVETTFTKTKVRLPMDDDFVVLMKTVKDDPYVKQWFSRNYGLAPLWKSKADFYKAFDKLRDVKLYDSSWIFSDDCKAFISQRFGIAESGIWIEKATPKYKGSVASKVKVAVNGCPIEYEKLFPKDVQSYEPPQNSFYFIYVPKDKDRGEIIEALKAEYDKYFFVRG